MSTESRAHRRTATVLALAFLFLASHVWSALHHAQERHVRCAEHGEWVHAPGPHPSPAASRDDAHADRCGDATPAASEGPSLAASERGDGAHDHCELASPHRERALPLLATFDLARPAGPVLLARAPREAPRAPAFPRHRLAPKQSPPC